MSSLILDSLEIRNFRGLKELKIEKLGRVNLIVGKNNVGKTSVLEALTLYARPASLGVLLDILHARNEVDRTTLKVGRTDDTPRLLPFHQLFHGRLPLSPAGNQAISIGATEGSPKVLTITVTTDPPGRENGTPRSLRLRFQRGHVVEFMHVLQPYDIFLNPFSEKFIGPEQLPLMPFNAGGMSNADLVFHWDELLLTPEEADVLAAVRLISSDIDRIGIKPIEEHSSQRAPFVTLRSFDAPVPLRSLGDGVIHVFSLALSMARAKNGWCLIDEFENGLHYSVQPEIWKFVFEVAQKLNVQVFATTHSYDCIQAFQEAAKASPGEDGKLIRIGQRAGRTLVAEFDERDMEIVVDGQIEVR